MKDNLSSLDRFILNKNTVRYKTIKQSMNYQVVNGIAYDTETGEYIGDKYNTPILEPIKMKNEYYESKLKNDNIIHLHNEHNGGFIFALFNDSANMNERFPSLNRKDITRLLYLSTFIHYETGRLQKGNGSRLNVENIHDEIRLSKRSAKVFINKLVNENILIIDENCLYINPTVFFKGSINKVKSMLKDMRYTRLFKNTVRNLFKDAKENELAHISVLYSVLPYINLNHNYICHNPLEEDIKYIEAMEIKELAYKIGYDRHDKLTPQLRKLRVNDKPVIAFYNNVDDGRKRHMIVNPDVIYGGNKAEHLEVLKGMFNKKEN